MTEFLPVCLLALADNFLVIARYTRALYALLQNVLERLHNVLEHANLLLPGSSEDLSLTLYLLLSVQLWRSRDSLC